MVVSLKYRLVIRFPSTHKLWRQIYDQLHNVSQTDLTFMRKGKWVVGFKTKANATLQIMQSSIELLKIRPITDC
jgi:hypothetical protein